MTLQYFQMIIMRILMLIDKSESEEYTKGLKDALQIIKEETGSK